MGSVRLYAARLLLLAACCCLCQPVLGRPSSSSQPLLIQRRSSGHYCGSHLTSMLEMLCGSGSVGKRADVSSSRTVTGNMHDYSGDQRANELGGLVRPLEFPSYNSRPRLLEAVDPLDGGRRRESRSVRPGGPDHVRVKRQGIVYECCFNACSLQVLQTYCSNS